MDYKSFIENYIKKQERFYNHPLKPFTKYVLRELALAIEKNVDRENVSIVKVAHQPNEVKIASKVSGNQISVALITEDVGHMTGGRYYCWFIASALVELGFDVVVYTNREPVFGKEFEKYQQPKIKIVCEKAKDLEGIDVQADIYIGSPISGDIAAAKLGAKYKKPAFALIFDPFPMMAKYLGQKNYVGWTPLIQILRANDTNIISLCNTTSGYIYEWLNKRKDQVYPIYPCINSRELSFDEPIERGDYVVFVSRLVAHKNFDHVLKACKNLGVRLKVIASVDGISADLMVQKMGMKRQVDFHMKISDKEKFDIIRGAKAVINGSKFEGFGMWYIEALACGTPTVCYDYPTIHEIQKFAGVDNVYMAKWDNSKSLEQKLSQALEESKYKEPTDLFNYETFMKRVQQVFTVEPKIGVITIALNEDKFIQASLKSVIKHSNVKKVAVVEGAVNLFPTSNEKGLSIDNTDEQVRQVISTDPDGDKIIYDRYGWAVDKSELRNRGLELLGKDITHVLVVDADEVWKQDDLDNLVQAMRDNPHTGVFLFPFYHFWKQKDLIATGGQWNAQLFRCFRYADKSLYWRYHAAPVVNFQGKFINVLEGQINLNNVHVYHYGYLKDEDRVLDKLEYYRKRDGDILKVKNTWSGWKQGMPTQPTHGEGIAEKFEGEHPKELRGIL